MLERAEHSEQNDMQSISTKKCLGFLYFTTLRGYTNTKLINNKLTNMFVKNKLLDEVISPVWM